MNVLHSNLLFMTDHRLSISYNWKVSHTIFISVNYSSMILQNKCAHTLWKVDCGRQEGEYHKIKIDCSKRCENSLTNVHLRTVAVKMTNRRGRISWEKGDRSKFRKNYTLFNKQLCRKSADTHTRTSCSIEHQQRRMYHTTKGER